ncbi:hypothetical protein F2Q69_00024046 [Brassica cretica]|uniref:SHSP domain-containing protein n=1 Tax=Brassica cretica TaxID=69181 RepID=A0A8S9QPG7_BRACR|nr:hypothetical protein F2Q69_00024046 [Brassica cretica]
MLQHSPCQSFGTDCKELIAMIKEPHAWSVVGRSRSHEERDSSFHRRATERHDSRKPTSHVDREYRRFVEEPRRQRKSPLKEKTKMERVSDISKPNSILYRSNEREREITQRKQKKKTWLRQDYLTCRECSIHPRIHATNNEFQRYGPKGFMEIKILENDNLYVRVDLPGVPDDGVRHRVDSVRQKFVFFSGEKLSAAKTTRKTPVKDSSTSEATSDGGRLFSLDLPGVCGDDMLVLPKENEVKFYGENKDVCEHDESCRIFMGAIKGSSFCAPGVPLLSHDIAWDAEFGVLKVRVSPPGSNISSE